MSRRRPLLEAIPNILAFLLAAGGNILGNVVAADMPDAIRREALPLQAAVLLLILLVSLLRRTVTSGRSRLRTRAALVLLLVYEGLWALGGLVSNLVAGNLPPLVRHDAPLVYPVLVVVALLIAALDFLAQSAPPASVTNRRNFLQGLDLRYGHRQHDALGGALQLVVGMRAVPEAVTQPALTTGTLAETNELADAHTVPAGTPIRQVYEAADGQLLILGEPGAGKTTLLVDLGLDLIRRARSNADLPIPAIFNLATWATNRLQLTNWLIEDLEFTYQVRRRTAEAWVETHAVLPLLDGLDEISDPQVRDRCVSAINAYHAEHPDLPLVVCSRLAAYQQQQVRLKLPHAVLLQPLTDAQITEYLTFGGEPLERLRAEVAADANLRDVMRTPLMLRLIVLTYGYSSSEAIPPVGDLQAWQRQVFEQYVERMLRRRRGDEEATRESPEETEPRYPPDEVRHFLAWLAVQLRVRSQVEFYLERLQPDWLPNQTSRHHYRRSAGLISGLVGGLPFGLVAGFVGGLVRGSVGSLVAGLVVGAIVGIVVGVVGRALVGVVLGLFGGAFSGVIGGIVGGGVAEIARPMIVVLFGAVVAALIGGGAIGLYMGLASAGLGLLGDSRLNDIRLRPILSWSWEDAREALVSYLFMGLIFGLGLVLFVGIFFLLSPASTRSLAVVVYAAVVVLAFGLAVGLGIGMPAGLLNGLETTTMSEQDYRVPGEVISRSLRNVLLTTLFGLGDGLVLGLIVGLMFGFVFGGLGGTANGFGGGLTFGLSFGMALGLVLGLALGLFSSALPAIQHLLLRRQLRRVRLLPPHLITFLNYAADHILLQKVGGGYRFIHGLLLDYFADLGLEEQKGQRNA